MKKIAFVFLSLILLTGCENNQSIVNSVEERQANEIVVFLASKGIAAQKIKAAKADTAANSSVFWDIYVDSKKSVEAMAILNQNGLPRIQGTNLLKLFSGEGLMTSDKEETIRYQAGLEEELKNTIRKIDGVLDADVRISFPATTDTLPGTETAKIKAAVYVKHQGIFDDPNQHLDSKIKRLVSGSIEGLTFEDVSVISDKSRFTDISLDPKSKFIGPKALEQEYVSIWSIIMTKNSAQKFRMIFFTMIFLILAFGAITGWMIYKFYPLLNKNKREK